MDKIRCLGCMEEYDSNQNFCPYCGASRDCNQEEPHFLRAGTILENRYLVGKAISSSNFSITYIAFDFQCNQKIVIKEYFPTDLASRMFGQNEISAYDGERAKRYETGLVAFIEEANNLKEISGSIDGVAKVLDVFIDNSTAYSVVEYIDGIPLSEVLKNGAIPWNDLIQVMNPLLESMEVIHAAGIINYNISPDNIVMTRNKSVKLLSFGGSKLAANLGTIINKGYSPIELYKENTDADPSIDVYSIAAVMYYAITGIVPTDAVERSNENLLESPLSLGVNLPVNVNNAIMNALNVNRTHRTPNCKVFYNELNSTDEVERVFENKKKEETGKIGKKGKIVIIASVIVAIVAIIGIVNAASNVKNKTEAIKKDDIIYSFEEKELDEVESYIKSYEENGVEINYTYRIDPNREDGSAIISQQKNIPSGAEKNGELKKLKLTVLIPPVKMPDLKGKSWEKATQTLIDLKINKSCIKPRKIKTNEYKEGTVVNQSVKAGEKIEDSDEVIFLSIAENYTTTTTTTSNRVYTTARRKKSNGSSSKSKTTTAKEKKESNTKKDGLDPLGG